MDITSVSLSRASGKAASGLDVMLRTSSKNRLRNYLLNSEE